MTDIGDLCEPETRLDEDILLLTTNSRFGSFVFLSFSLPDHCATALFGTSNIPDSSSITDIFHRFCNEVVLVCVYEKRRHTDLILYNIFYINTKLNTNWEKFLWPNKYKTSFTLQIIIIVVHFYGDKKQHTITKNPML